MAFQFLLFFIFTIASLWSEESNSFTPALTALGERYPLSNLEGEPSSIVGGCVNVISGDFFVLQRDLLLEGTESLSLERYYASSDVSEGSLCQSWHLNHQGNVYIGSYDLEEGGQIPFAEYKGPFGSEMRFDQSFGQKNMCIHPEMLKKGLTNCANGHLGCKTNPKNLRLSISKESCTLARGGGERLFFSGKSGGFDLLKEHRSSGNSLNYTYKKHRLQNVTVKNKVGEALQHLSFAYLEEKEFRKRPRVVVTAYDGRSVTYKFQKFKDINHLENDLERFYLREVERSNGTWEKYYYENQSERYKHFERVIRKELPEGHYLEVNYYKVGTNYLTLGQKVHYDENHPAINRVKAIKGPIETDGQSHSIYLFDYHLPNGREGAGFCNVYDANRVRTDYFWDDELRIKSLVKYTANDAPYIADHFAWGVGPNHGNLTSHTFTSGGENLFCRCYLYDHLGNVTHDFIYGNLTGKNSAPLLVDAFGYPVSNGCEGYLKTMRYYPDGKLQYESDGRHTKTYSYHPDTDLIATIFTWDGDKIVLRQGFIYDNNGALIFSFTDDGCCENLNDLQGVSLRKITHFVSQAVIPAGLPAHVEERVLDLATGQELLVKVWKNSYTKEGWITCQEEYDSQGAHVNTKRWDYDPRGNVILEVNVLGEIIQRKYDLNNNLIEECGPRFDRKKVFTYDFAGRLIHITEFHGDHRLDTHYRYNKLGQKIAEADCYGNETNYGYDEFGRLVEVAKPVTKIDQNSTNSSVTRWNYDPMGNPNCRIDQEGNRTFAAYTIRGQPYKVVYSDGSVEESEYSPDGLLVKSIAKNGLTTCYSYDYQDRITKTECYNKEGELLWETSASYNGFHLLSESDALGHVTNYTYDVYGRKASEQKGDLAINYTYDSKGRLAKVITRLSAEEVSLKVFAYDLLDRVVEERIEDFQGNVLTCEHYDYDLEGHKIAVITWGEEGTQKSETHYNSYGTPFLQIDALGNKTVTIDRFDYINELGQRVPSQEITDPLGNITLIVKDAHYRETLIIRKNAINEVIQRKEILYDLLGNRKKTIETVFSPDNSQKTIQHVWEYDGMQRCAAFIENWGDIDEKRTCYRYNNFGELIELQKPSSVSLLYTYDCQGLLTDYCGSDNSFHYSYIYDKKQRPVEITDEINHLSSFKFFDENDRLVAVQDLNGQTIRYIYDYGGRVIEKILPDGSKIKNQYDSIHLKQIDRLTADNHLLYSHTYDRFDLSGRVLEEAFLDRVGKLKRKFDEVGRVVSAETERFEDSVAFDAGGNLIKRQVSDLKGDLECAYSYDELNQLASESGISTHQYGYDSLYNRISKDDSPYELNQLNQVLFALERVFNYDACGNLKEQIFKKGKKIEYFYDALDRLVEVKGDKISAKYSYDADNHRVAKTVICGKKKVTTRFIYDGDNEIGSIDEKERITQLRVLGVGLGAEIGAAVAIELNDEVYAPMHDVHGNVVALVKPDGKVKEFYRYSAFGEEQIYNESGKKITNSMNPWRYCSKRSDDETGWVFFGRRFYFPELGRWVTKDPSGFEGGSNLYAFVQNTPLTLLDFFGLVAEGVGMWERVRDSFSRVSDSVTHFVKDAVHSVGKVLHQAVHRTGHLLYDFGHHCVPLPILKDIPMFAGFKMMGGEVYTMSYNLPHSTLDVTQGSENSQTKFGFVGGQNYTYNSSHITAEGIGKANGGAAVNYVSNQTHGAVGDTLKSIVLMFIGNMHTVEKAAKMIQELVDTGCNDIRLYAHSQGALVVYNALKKIQEESLGNITLYTFGAAKFLSKGQLKDCVNYVSIFDPIPFVANALGNLKSFFSKDYKVEYLPPKIPFFDHCINSGPYNDQIKKLGSTR